MKIPKHLPVLSFLILLLACSLEASAQITYPSPSFDYAPLTPRVGDPVTFNATLFVTHWTESTLTDLDWDFADGTTDHGALVTHTFTQSGEYGVSLTATDDRGYGGTSQLLVTVTAQTPVTIYSSLSSESIYIGENVIISGNLTANGQGVPNETIAFSTQTFQDNAPWVEIGNTKTDNAGSYSFVWQTSQPSGYQVRAMWAGNSTYPQTSLSQMLYVKPYGDLITGFSSNSTVSELNFNMTTRLLTFKVEGPSETTGYVDITLEDDPAFNPENLTVLLDGQPLQYTLESTNPSWKLHFTYTHSSHNVIVDFTGNSVPQGNGGQPSSSHDEETPTASELPILVILAAVIVVVAVVALGLIVYRMKHR
jgi:hypothetical protein